MGRLLIVETPSPNLGISGFWVGFSASTITHKMITEPNFIIFILFSVFPAL